MIFLVSGLLLLVGTIVIGLQLVTGDPTFLKTPFELAPPLGYIISYLGLLGLYPRLADSFPRLARVSIVLLLLPVVVLLVYVVTVALGSDFPFADTISIAAFLLFAVGIALFGVGSYQATSQSSTIGLSLLVLSLAWFVFIGAGLVNGYPVSQPVTFGTTAIMTLAILAIGYLLYTEADAAGPAEPAPDTAPR